MGETHAATHVALRSSAARQLQPQLAATAASDFDGAAWARQRRHRQRPAARYPLGLFNSGRALEPGAACFTEATMKVAKRAIAARKGRKMGVREFNTVRNAVVHAAHS